MTFLNAPDETDQGPPPRAPSHRARWIIAISALCILVVGGATAITITLNHRQDTGITGCQAVASDAQHHVGARAYTKADYHRQRQDFTGSRYPDLSHAGTVYLDTIWTAYQQDRAGKYGAIDYGAIVTTNNDLAAACANHATAIPTLTG